MLDMITLNTFASFVTLGLVIALWVNTLWPRYMPPS